jgi:hypothetical protein
MWSLERDTTGKQWMFRSWCPFVGEMPWRSVLCFYGRNPRGRNTSGRLLAYKAIPLFKCHSLGLQAYSDAVREVFPTRVTRGFIMNSRETRWIFTHTLQITCATEKTTILRSQLTVVVVTHPQLASLQNKIKRIST